MASITVQVMMNRVDQRMSRCEKVKVEARTPSLWWLAGVGDEPWSESDRTRPCGLGPV
jgi:hypothetical protein